MVALSDGEPGPSSPEAEDHEHTAAASAAAETPEIWSRGDESTTNPWERKAMSRGRSTPTTRGSDPQNPAVKSAPRSAKSAPRSARQNPICDSRFRAAPRWWIGAEMVDGRTRKGGGVRWRKWWRGAAAAGTE
jgi:hypothetical protein